MVKGFVKVAAVVPSVRVADCDYNVKEIITCSHEAANAGVQIAVFPELCITGYSCGDLFAQRALLDAAESGLRQIAASTRGHNMVLVVGMPIETGHALANAAVVVHKGEVRGVTVKSFLPNYKEFYEQRWFASARDVDAVMLCGQWHEIHPYQLYRTPETTFCIEICEDLWATIPPSSHMALAGAEIILNLSASNELIGKNAYLESLIAQQSARCLSAYVYSSCGFGESSTDVVFGGNAIVYENGTLIGEGRRFSMMPQMTIADVDVERLRYDRRVNTTFSACGRIQSVGCSVIELDATERDATTLCRRFDPRPFVPSDGMMHESCEEIFNIQCAGLAKRIAHTGVRTAVIGISGGLDSTLALLVAVRTFDILGRDRKGIIGITMPGFGTTDRTHDNAVRLMQSLGVTLREISISKAVRQHFADIGHDEAVHDVTYENSQARERTQLLMDVANQTNGIVVGTGDLSELVLGWATYNGDHMSMYGVNASIPKTLVRYLVRWVAENGSDELTRDILLDVIDTPVSPELLPADADGNIAQKTEDLVGPYELHDFFLYYVLRYGMSPTRIYAMARRAFDGVYSTDVIKKWLHTFYRRFFAQQFKRSCMPDGPKVGSVSVSPRGDWRMPSDAVASVWMKEVEML